MEGRFNYILLIILASLALHLTPAHSADSLQQTEAMKALIEPEVERIKFDESKIESTDFEIIAAFGVLNIEDFGTNSVIGFKLGYHVSDDLFIGAELASSKGSKTSAETINNFSILTDEDREILYYLLTVGYNILPGEAFVSDGLTYNTAFYINAGLGSTEFAGDTQSTMSIGIGYRVLINNYLSVYSDMSNIFFTLDILGEDKLTHNLQFTIGLGYHF